MPNAINRFKPNQILKVEKENENIDIRRKLRSMQKDKFLNPKTETVWERLSKVRKCPSNDGSLCSGVRSRHNLHAKSNHRFPINMRSINGPQNISKKPLILNTTTNKRGTFGNGGGLACNTCSVGVTLDRKMTRKSKANKQHMFLTEKTHDPMPYLTHANSQAVKELMTARSICNSKSSSDDSKKGKKLYAPKTHTNNVFFGPASAYENPSLDVNHLNFGTFSQDSFDDYEMAPLMQVPTRDSLNFSAKITNNFKNILDQKKRSMDPDEIKVIKNVVKTDERHRQLQRNDSELFKDILKTQLKQILKQESVVKSALSKLDDERVMAMEKQQQLQDDDEHLIRMSDSTVSTNHMRVRSKTTREELTKTPTDELENIQTARTDSVLPAMAVTVSGAEKSIVYKETTDQMPQVDVIFKNVPTLEKEIIILKALGEKLEATLRRTASVRSISIRERRTASTSTSNMTPPPVKQYILDKTEQIGFRIKTNIATIEVYKIGIRQIMGLAKEFRIAQKTIVELKEEANRHFYLPSNDEKTELRRTSFRKLKANPDILMRHLRPKNTLVPFNVLDQDPMFFNSFILQNQKSTSDSPFSSTTFKDENSEDSGDVIKLREGGDSATFKKSEVKIETTSTIPKVQSKDFKPILVYPRRRNETKKLESKIKRRTTFSDEFGPPEGDIPTIEKPAESIPKFYQNDKNKTKYKFDSDKVDNNSVAATTSTVNNSNESINTTLREKESSSRTQQQQQQHQNRPARYTTPMPARKYVEPKNNLLKTILVGSLQISVFILLIMAITYPEAKC